MLIQSRKQFDTAIDILMQAPRAACDTETNGLYVHKGHRLCGVAFHVELKDNYVIGFYFPFRHAPGESLFDVSENLPIEWLSELGKVLARPDLTTDWHNYKFDARMLRAEGIEIVGPFFDCMVGAVLIDETADHSLAGVEKAFLGTTTKKENEVINLKPYLKGKKDYSKVPPAKMELYACNDVRVTYDVKPHIVEELKRQELWHLWPDSEILLRQLFEMEWEGVPVDQELAAHNSAQAEGRMRELEDAMGFDPQKRAVLARNLFCTPPEGLGLRIPRRVTSDTSPEFPQGIPGMDNEELLALIDPDPTCDDDARRANDLVSNVLEYRGLVKANSTWYRGFIQHSGSDGNIHPSYNTVGDRDKYGTVTSRLTCSEPNIQQLPRDPSRGVYKQLLPDRRRFGGTNGHPRCRLYVVDYNQIEYRLGSVYADETDVLETYRAGGDMHLVVANKLGIPRTDPKGGVDGKKVNFTCYYGASGTTIAKLMKLPVEQGQAIHMDYWQALPKTRKFIWQCTKAAKARGYIKLWNGRKRHFKHEWEYHKAFNSLVQGGAAQIMERSMVMFYKANLPVRVAFQIHDALGLMVPIDFEKDYLEEIRAIMEWPTAEFPIDFPVEFKSIHPIEPHVCKEGEPCSLELSTQEPQLVTLST